MTTTSATHREIANTLRTLANLFDSLGYEGVKTVGEHLKDAGIPDNAIEAPKVEKTKKADKPKKTETIVKDAVVVPPATPPPTPEKIANDLKVKLVALVGKNRVKAVAILASVGAKKFSDIPVDQHAKVLLAISAALDDVAPAAESDDDPLA